MAATPETTTTTTTTYFYSCGSCSKPLFLDEHINGHEPGDGQTSFEWNKRDAAVDSLSAPECTSYFVDRMAWMGSMDANEGKLSCPKCKAKVGKYTWSGAQCSCGAWISPAVQVAKAKVDAKPITTS